MQQSATIIRPGSDTSAVSGAFSVDITRGERIGRVSSEWFSRPYDERYLSLDTLYDAVRARADRATARTVETRTFAPCSVRPGVPFGPGSRAAPRAAYRAASRPFGFHP